jgi:sporulation protein YlmC with PRC-barrel domain
MDSDGLAPIRHSGRRTAGGLGFVPTLYYHYRRFRKHLAILLAVIGPGINRYYLLTELLDKPVSTSRGVTVGRLNDLEFIDDPKYGEVTGVVVRRPFGRPPLRVPWSEVVQVSPTGMAVRDPPDGTYPEFEPQRGQIQLRDMLLDKRILDTHGIGVDVVYDFQLLLASGKLFVAAADVSGRARRRRLGLVGRRGRTVPDGGTSEARIPWRYVQPIDAGVTSTKETSSSPLLARRLVASARRTSPTCSRN